MYPPPTHACTYVKQNDSGFVYVVASLEHNTSMQESFEYIITVFSIQVQKRIYSVWVCGYKHIKLLFPFHINHTANQNMNEKVHWQAVSKSLKQIKPDVSDKQTDNKQNNTPELVKSH